MKRRRNSGPVKVPAAIPLGRGWPTLALASLLAACTQPQLKPDPHYVLGRPYQVGTVWYYPKDSFDFNETGLAAVIKSDSPRLTTDGEVFDQTALAAAHPTLQLPAIARLTNLENGRETTVRVNDRGSGDPRRLIEITSRTAVLLAFPPDGVARVRVRLLPSESHAAADGLPGAPSLAMTAAPRGVVEVAELPPDPGVRQSSIRGLPNRAVIAAQPAPQAAPPMRLAETLAQTPPRPGQLIVRLDRFDNYHYAADQCAKMGWSNAHIVELFEGRAHHFQVDSSPLPDVARADMVLNQALAAGIPDARIVVD